MNPLDFLKRGLGTDPVQSTAMMLMNMAAAQPQPAVASVSGTDVIGLGERGTTALLDRLQQGTQFEAQQQARQQAQQQAQLEGMGERIFRAQELEQYRRMQAEQRREERQQADQLRADEEARRARQGQIIQTGNGGLSRVIIDPATGAATVEQIAQGSPEIRSAGDGSLGYVQDGAWVPVSGAPTRPQTGGGGGGGSLAGYFAGLLSYPGQDGKVYLAQRSRATGQPEPLMINGAPVPDTPENRYYLTGQGYVAFPNSGAPVGQPATVGGKPAQGAQTGKTREDAILEIAKGLLANNEEPAVAAQRAAALYDAVHPPTPNPVSPTAVPDLANVIESAQRGVLGGIAAGQPAAQSPAPAPVAQPQTPPSAAPAGFSWEQLNGTWVLVKEGE